MKSTAKSQTSYGFEDRATMTRACRDVLAITERNVITRDGIIRELGIPAMFYMHKSTPIELMRIRRLVSHAMGQICEEEETEWLPFGSRHNPQWIRKERI